MRLHEGFSVAGPAVVRSVVQRGFLNTWIRLRAQYGGYVPRCEFSPSESAEHQKDFVEYQVSKAGSAWDFIIVSRGSSAAKAYGTAATDNRGTSLWDYLAPEMRVSILPLYIQCAEAALPVYSASQVEDANGSLVTYERLRLPFQSQGQVDTIIVSLKAISKDGRFELDNLLRNPSNSPSYAQPVVIATNLSGGVPKREAMSRRPWADASNSSDDIIEL